MHEPCNERQVRFPARTPTSPPTTPNPHNRKAQSSARGVGADPRRAQNGTRPAGRSDQDVHRAPKFNDPDFAAYWRANLEQTLADERDRRSREARADTRIMAVLFVATALLIASTVYSSIADAAPRPNTPHPLDYNARSVARALPEWGINALEQADASGWYWTPTRSVCVRTKPAHYRCDATGSWSTVGEPGVRVTYRLRYCTSSRRIGNHALYRDGATWRARIRVDYRGGLACRVPNPPYIPAS